MSSSIHQLLGSKFLLMVLLVGLCINNVEARVGSCSDFTIDEMEPTEVLEFDMLAAPNDEVEESCGLAKGRELGVVYSVTNKSDFIAVFYTVNSDGRGIHYKGIGRGATVNVSRPSNTVNVGVSLGFELVLRPERVNPIKWVFDDEGNYFTVYPLEIRAR